MNIIIRVDSSTQLGTGHLMRCLTLADALREKGAEVAFICRELPGNLCTVVKQKGYIVFRLPYYNEGASIESVNKDIDYSNWLGVGWQLDAEQTKDILVQQKKEIHWLVVDNYSLDIKWELMVRPFVRKIIVIDDLANRKHDCDLLLDQNLYEHLENRYTNLIPEKCKQLLGPKFALLRPEFCKVKKHLRKRDGTVKNILIFFGGSDPTNETQKALGAIKLFNKPDITVDVVVGSNNPNKKVIERICSTTPNIFFHCQVDNMAYLMANSDLAIGAGGISTWERCCLELPSLIIVVAENQDQIAKMINKCGAGINIGEHINVSPISICKELLELIQSPKLVLKMGFNASKIIDGKGIFRVISKM